MNGVEAKFYEKNENESVSCRLCPHHCRTASGHMGLCGVRRNKGGILYAESYGQATALSLDAIEKKPLFHFHPGSFVLSVGSYGCNFRCSFCQNHTISMENPPVEYISPEDLVSKAKALVSRGNIGIAFTYNEPFISYEYLRDAAVLAHKEGLMNVVVTNGFIEQEPLRLLLPYVDAINIDLKSMEDSFYRNICGGSLEYVKDSIVLAAGSCHVEVTTLVIPGENDSEGQMERLSEFLASVDDHIPLHISRFFPRFHMADREATPKETIENLSRVAKKYLKYVYMGNIK